MWLGSARFAPEPDRKPRLLPRLGSNLLAVFPLALSFHPQAYEVETLLSPPESAESSRCMISANLLDLLYASFSASIGLSCRNSSLLLSLASLPSDFLVEDAPYYFTAFRDFLELGSLLIKYQPCGSFRSELLSTIAGSLAFLFPRLTQPKSLHLRFFMSAAHDGKADDQLPTLALIVSFVYSRLLSARVTIFIPLRIIAKNCSRASVISSRESRSSDSTSKTLPGGILRPFTSSRKTPMRPYPVPT